MSQIARPNAEAAQRVGYAPGTFANMRVSGHGPKYVKIGRKVLYRDQDVDAWLESHLRASTSEASA